MTYNEVLMRCSSYFNALDEALSQKQRLNIDELSQEDLENLYEVFANCSQNVEEIFLALEGKEGLDLTGVTLIEYYRGSIDSVYQELEDVLNTKFCADEVSTGGFKQN